MQKECAFLLADLSQVWPEANQHFSKEIDDEANSYFQRIYNHPPHPTMSVDEVRSLIKASIDQPDVPPKAELTFLCTDFLSRCWRCCKDLRIPPSSERERSSIACSAICLRSTDFSPSTPTRNFTSLPAYSVASLRRAL